MHKDCRLENVVKRCSCHTKDMWDMCDSCSPNGVLMKDMRIWLGHQPIWLGHANCSDPIQSCPRQMLVSTGFIIKIYYHEFCMLLWSKLIKDINTTI